MWILLWVSFLCRYDSFSTKKQDVWKNVRPVMEDLFRKWANHFFKRFTDQNVVQHPIWPVLAPLCAMRYIKDEQYLPGNDTPGLLRVRDAQKNICGLLPYCVHAQQFWIEDVQYFSS